MDTLSALAAALVLEKVKKKNLQIILKQAVHHFTLIYCLELEVIISLCCFLGSILETEWQSGTLQAQNSKAGGAENGLSAFYLHAASDLRFRLPFSHSLTKNVYLTALNIRSQEEQNDRRNCKYVESITHLLPNARSNFTNSE